MITPTIRKVTSSLSIVNSSVLMSAAVIMLGILTPSAYAASLKTTPFSKQDAIGLAGETKVRAETETELPGNSLDSSKASSMFTSKSIYFTKLIEKQLSIIDQFKYYQERGAWQPVSAKGYFEEGDEEDAIQQINHYLDQYALVTGMEICQEERQAATVFSSCTKQNVKTYQAMHGLQQDGVVGPSTLREMRKPIEEKIAELRLNLERIQKYAKNSSRNMILINISDYSISFIRNDQTFFQSKVIVGTRHNQTEIISDQLSYFVVNPQWNIPPSIVKEIAPKVIEDPEYLKNKNIVIYEDGYHGQKVLQANSIDWEKYKSSYFPYYMVQKPGDDNPLGRVKYMFPNHHSIYVHDTSNRALFNSSNLMRSHGCIRMQDPFQLAEAIAKYDLNPKAWQTIRDSRWTDESVIVSLNEPIDVHIVYWTAWVDNSHSPQFRQDIYRNDIALKQRYMETPENLNIATN